MQGFWAKKWILTCPQVAISGIVYFGAVVARDREDRLESIDPVIGD